MSSKVFEVLCPDSEVESVGCTLFVLVVPHVVLVVTVLGCERGCGFRGCFL